jgi:hypothetical protein
MSHYLTAAEIDEIYPKIDINDDGNIEWHEFTSFLIAAEGNSQLASLTSSYRLIYKREQVFTSGQNVPSVGMPNTSVRHTDMISHMCMAMKPFPMVVTGARDGQVLIWRLSDLSFVKKLNHECRCIFANVLLC